MHITYYKVPLTYLLHIDNTTIYYYYYYALINIKQIIYI
jgi:hypothetical protein